MLTVNQLSVSQVFDTTLEFLGQALAVPSYKFPYQPGLPSFSDFTDALCANHSQSLIRALSYDQSGPVALDHAPALDQHANTYLAPILEPDWVSNLDSNANNLDSNLANNLASNASNLATTLEASPHQPTWLAAADGSSYGSHDDVNNSILNEVFQGSLGDSDTGGTYQAAPILPNHQTNQTNTLISQLDSKFSLDNMHPELLLQEPVLILILAVIFEMLLPIPLRFKFSGLQPIFHRLGHKVNLPHSSNSQRAFAGFFLPLLLLVFCEGIVLFLDIFTVSDSIITLMVMLYLLELRYPQETAVKISRTLSANKERARDLLYPYVLRDVSKLSSMGIAKAACESTILRIVHGWFAVMVWYFIGGIEGAVLMQCCVVMSRAFNYKLPENYLFGRIIFMLLELMLLIPALALGLMLMFSKNPLSPWIKGMQGMQVYPAPITGFILGAVGGALNLSLSGPRYYFGRLIRLPRVGGSQEPDSEAILRVMRKIRLSGILMLLIALVITIN